MNEIEFTLNGQHTKLSNEQVLSKLQGIPPEPVRELTVKIDGITYPVKQAFHVVLDIDRADFTSHQARSIFQKLGFAVKRV